MYYFTVSSGSEKFLHSLDCYGRSETNHWKTATTTATATATTGTIWVTLTIYVCHSLRTFKWVSLLNILKVFWGKLPFVHNSASSFRRHVMTERGKKLHSYGRNAKNVANGSSERRHWRRSSPKVFQKSPTFWHVANLIKILLLDRLPGYETM